MSESGKIALVTGANRGLGFEASRQLATLGYTVIMTGRDEKKIAEVAGELKKEGLEVAPYRLDITQPADILRLNKRIENQFGILDVLINNAGVYLDDPGASDILSTPPEIILKTMESNLFGALRLCRAFLPKMIERGTGCVVNVSSGMGEMSAMTSDSVGYRLSKSALNSLTRMLADHVKGTDIKVNAVCPGWVRTGMGGPNAPRSLEEGAASIVWAATLGSDGPTGGFYRDGIELEW